MIYIHSYSYQEDIVNTIENKQFSHTMGNQDTCYESALYHIMLMYPVLNVHSLHEYLTPNNLILPKVLLDLVPFFPQCQDAPEFL